MSERFAIYFAPAADHPLWLRAAQWLGRDPLSGEEHSGPLGEISRTALAERSVSARRYGFHATIKPPMTLAEGTSRAELEGALAGYAASMEPVSIGPMQLALLDGFLALIPQAQTTDLTDFAAEVVAEFDRFRAPMGPTERDRRLAGGKLSPRQVELVDRFGYPYVQEQFRLHMTLTDRLPETEREAYRDAAATFFGPLGQANLMLDRLVLFHEQQPGAPFVRLADYVLTGEADDERIRAR